LIMRLADRFNIKQLIAQRADQRSFHISSQDHVRIEFHNFSPGQNHAFLFDGNVILTCYTGEFRLTLGMDEQSLTELDQVVIVPGTPVRVECRSAGTIEFIWSPPFARMSGIE
jgi:quercetin dioxygenase-like cupin family protein